MKRITSILMALIMVLGLSTTAFATTLNINDGGDRNYKGYKILELAVSLKATSAEGCSVDHTSEGAATATGHKDACYTYVYTATEKYANILMTATGAANAGEIVDKLAALKGDQDGGTLRPVADRIYRAIKDAKLTADATDLDGENDEIAQGYWLIADVTTVANENDATSLVMVDTAGLETLTITPKTGLPTVEKKVKDTNDSTGETSGWQDSADRDIGDTVPFKLTATLPANVTDYDTYEIVFHDTLSKGLTLIPGSIKVEVYANKDTMTGTDVTTNFTKPDTAPTDGIFAVGCDNILDIKGMTVTKDSIFVVTYNAILNNEAEIGAKGNPNEVYLEFSNDPYSAGTGATEEDKVIVFTYELIINKVDAENKPLSGADFTLYKKNSVNEFVEVAAKPKAITNGTTFTWTGLDDGVYQLKENIVPTGYNGMADLEFTISAEHTQDPEELKLKSLTSTLGTVNDGTITESIQNLTGTVLPETGARGTVMLIGGGSLFVIVAAVFMVTRKKMSVYEY